MVNRQLMYHYKYKSDVCVSLYVWYVSQFANESRYTQNIKHLCCWDALVLETAKNNGLYKDECWKQSDERREGPLIKRITKSNIIYFRAIFGIYEFSFTIRA